MADNIKISALTELVSGSITGTTIVPLVDGGVTLKAQMSSLKAFTNSDVATDAELANQIASVNNTISGLGTDDISEGTAQFYTDARVKTKLDTEGVLSGSFPAGYNLGVIGGGTSVSTVDSITVYGATVTDNGSGDIALSIDSGSQLNLQVSDGSTTVTDVDSISVTGGTVTDNGSGDVTLTIPVADVYSLTVSDERLESIADVTQIKLVGAIVDDSGSGIIQVTIDGNDVSLLNTFTGSIDSRVNVLEIADDVSELNIFTGSFSSSMEGRVTTLESAGGGGEATPEGTISSSQQITDFGFVSSSRKFDGLGLVSIISASNDPDETIQIQVTPGGGGADGVAYDNNFHIISQSSTLPGQSNIILTDVKLGIGLNDFKFIDFSESLDSRFGSGGGSDYISNVAFSENQLTFTGNNNGFNGVVGLSSGIVSSSTQITELGFANTSDINEAYIKDRLPQDLISGSEQITDFGFASNESTSSLASKDAITGSFTELSASLSARIGNEGSGITEARLGEVTASMLNGGSVDGNDNVVTLVSSSQQITYSGVTDTPYFIGDGVTITSGSDVSNIPYFNLSAGSDSYILAHTASLNYHSASISASVDALIVDSGSFSERVTAVEVSSGTARFDSLEARTGSVDNSINELNTFTGSFSASVAQRIDDVAGAGGGADYVSNVVLNGTDLTFTGQGGGFNSSVDLASLSTGGGTDLTEASYGLISQSYDLSTTNLEIGNVVIGGTSGDVTLSTVSESFDTRINAINGATELSGLSDVGTITNDVADGDILLYDSVEQEFTHSKDLTGDYKITGSLDTKGSMGLSGSLTVIGTVTADSFVAGDVGTPTIDSATDLDLSATNYITIDAGNQITITTPSRLQLSASYVSISDVLTIEQRYDTPTLGDVPTGSIIVSASVDRPKPWMWDGLDWNPFY